MNNNAQGNSGAGNSKIQNFLEALRASQGNINPSSGQESRNNPFLETSAKKEQEKRRAEQFHQARQQEWNKVYSAKERQKEQRIEELRTQLKNFSKQVKRLDTNLVKAVASPVISAGSYDESFLDHIKGMIHLSSLKVSSANSWLEAYNSRSAKQGNYWSQAKSKGTSFTQNNERAIATSVG